MTVSINGTSGIVNDATDLNYTGTLTGGTGVVNLGSGQFYKDASGNVGIGTSSPGSKLDINRGSAGLIANFTDGVNTNFQIGTSSLVATIGPSAGSTAMAFKTGDTERARIDSSGNVGIGTSSPLTKLHLLDSAAVFIQMTDSGDGASRIGQNGTALTFGVDAANGTTERARIDSSGNLLVGTASASYGARSVIQNNGTTTQPSISCINSTGSGTMRQIDFFTGSNTSRIGSIESTTSTTAYNTSSDYRLKENIAPMTGALAAVTALNPVTYTWKVDGFAGQGFIAHELAEVCPDAVSGEKDAVDAEGNPQYQGIDTSFLVATLAAAIQELKAVVDEQSILIAAQATRITALEGTAA